MKGLQVFQPGTGGDGFSILLSAGGEQHLGCAFQQAPKMMKTFR